jgi:glycosyltransferase involved in cell wall biosynthesis
MLITVFTATFNRYNELKRVYECLKLQTYHDFEWIIVNDGSSDNTDELVNTWISEKLLDIKYYYQPNQGKHIAFNYGVRVALGTMFVNLDSDDVIVPNALELFVKYWDEIGENNQVFLKDWHSGVWIIKQKKY